MKINYKNFYLLIFYLFFAINSFSQTSQNSVCQSTNKDTLKTYITAKGYRVLKESGLDSITQKIVAEKFKKEPSNETANMLILFENLSQQHKDLIEKFLKQHSEITLRSLYAIVLYYSYELRGIDPLK